MPALYEVADAVPEPAGPGRPPDFPPWMHLAFAVMVSACRSKRAAEAFFRTPSTWKVVQDTLVDAWPGHDDRRVGPKPIRR